MTASSERPSHDAFVITGKGKAAFWTKIGAVWPHEDGKGFNVELAAFPVNGRVVLRTPKERDATAPEGEA